MTESAMEKWRKIPAIFACFFKIGPVTFGGGYAIIPLIEKEVVDKRKWLDPRDVTDVFALAQSIPGAIAINSSMFIGYRIAGIFGAVAAMIGVLLPTFLIVLGLAVLFLHVNDHPKVEAAFQGIRPAIVALICFAGYKIAKTAVLDKTTFAVMAATVAILFVPHIHPALVIICGFFVGFLIVALRTRFGLKTKLEPKREDEQEWGYMMGDGI